MDQVKNFAKGTLGGTIEAADTSITLLTGHGARFPDVPFNATIWNAADYPDPSDDPIKERVRVTARTGDTLTAVTRGLYGTSAEDHNEAGKVYQIESGFSVETILEMVGDVFGTGIALLVLPDENRIRLRFSSGRYLQLDDVEATLQSVSAKIGDIDGEDTGALMAVDATNSRLILQGLDLATTQIESASVAVGTLNGKLPLKDGSGTLVGYIPVHTTIT